MTEIVYYLKGLLLYKDTIDIFDFVLRTMIWMLILSAIYFAIKKIYNSLLKTETRDRRTIKLVVVEKKDNTYKSGFSTGFTFVPGVINHEVILECPDSGINFMINNKNTYNSVKVGESVTAEIEDIYGKICISNSPMEFIKYQISNVKKENHVG